MSDVAVDTKNTKPKKKKMPKKRGRPASDDPNVRAISLKVTRGTYARVMEKAKIRDLSVSGYMRQILNLTL